MGKRGTIRSATCERCGVAFETTRSRKRFCCEQHQKASAIDRYKARHPERAKAMQLSRVRAYAAAHPDRVRASRRKTDAARRDDPSRRASGKARFKAWVAAHPEAQRENLRRLQAQRRARKAAVGGTISAAEWRCQLETFGHACAYCLRTDAPLQMEHVIPISRGGRHDLDNVVPSCSDCNYRKRACGPLAIVNRREAA